MRDTSRSCIFPQKSLWAVAFCLLVLPLVWLVPPFQAPDDYDHFFMAASLFSERGVIDREFNNIAVVMQGIPFHYEKKYTRDRLHRAQEMRFSGHKVKAGLKLFSYYLPVAYLPQQLGSILAKTLGLQPYDVLFVAKIFNVCCIAGIFCLGLWRGAATPAAVLFMFLPMGLFLSASHSSDGVNIALTFLSAVIYAKSMREKFISTADQIILFISLTVLICHRLYMFPLILAPLFIYHKYHEKKLLFMSIAIASILCIWLAYVTTFIVDGAIYHNGVKLSHSIYYYLSNPLTTLHIFSNTLTLAYIHSLTQQFIGVLGWLDAPLAPFAYTTLLILYGIILLCTFNIKKDCITLSSLFLVLGPIFCIFFMLLVSFTQFPNANMISGVQGRYFICPAIYAAVTLFNSDRMTKYKYGKAFITSISLLSIIVSSSSVVYCLVNRYYI